MEKITQAELAEVYGVSDRTLKRWKAAKVDLFDPAEVYSYVAGLTRKPPKMREYRRAVRRFEELTDRKLENSVTKAGPEGALDITTQIAQEKLRKLRAEADRIEFLLAQSKNEFVSLSDDVSPAQTQIFAELCEEIEASYAELGELCDRLSGNEIMSKGRELFHAIRERFHLRLEKIIEDLAA